MSSEPGDGNLFVKWSRKQRDKRGEYLFHIGFYVKKFVNIRVTTYMVNYQYMLKVITLTNTFPFPVNHIQRNEMENLNLDLLLSSYFHFTVELHKA